MRHGDVAQRRGLNSSLGCARDFACGLKRPQNGSTSTPAYSQSSLAVGQDDRGKEARYGTDKSVP
jgi:hypothetical protein